MVSQVIQTKDQLQMREVTERYEVLRLLGQGTYGKVQLVCCKITTDKLALKQLLKARVAFRDFKRELNYSYFLSAHPSIINTYTTAFQSTDYWAFVQEASEHGDILSVIEPGIGVGIPATKKVMKQVASALAFMHSVKLCHRDVKPENMLLFDKESWRVKLTDFGLTCKVDTVVRRKTVDNNPYTPPEVCDRIKNEGFTVNTAGDVWQCGITMYCLLTGTYPWEIACIKTDKPYSNFKRWAQHKRGRTPPNWACFNGRLQKLFRKLLHHQEDLRSSVDTILKHVEHEWTITGSTEKQPSLSSFSESDEEFNKKAKQELRTKLEGHGIPTLVSKALKNARIHDWVLYNDTEPDYNNNNLA